MSASGAPARAQAREDASAPAREPRPMRADAQRNYAKLLDAANAAFLEHGADDVSLEEIARRAGVGAGTLYRHFPTRQALLEAVYRDDIAELSAQAYELLERLPPDEALAEWLRLQVAYVIRKRGLGAAVFAAVGKESELFLWCREALRGAGTALLAAGQRAGTVRADVDE